jgi:hypothetical protein
LKQVGEGEGEDDTDGFAHDSPFALVSSWVVLNNTGLGVAVIGERGVGWF